jgi:hypothetical protein
MDRLRLLMREQRRRLKFSKACNEGIQPNINLYKPVPQAAGCVCNGSKCHRIECGSM